MVEEEEQNVEEDDDVIFVPNEYNVEAIRGFRIYNRKIQFLIKWRGYPDVDNTWEFTEKLEHQL